MKMRLLGEMLVNEGLLDRGLIAPALREQEKTGERFGQVLVRLGYVSERDIIKPLSAQLGMPSLQSHEYPQTPPDVEGVPTVKFMRQYKVIPVERADGVLMVAAADPLAAYPLEAMRISTGLDVEP